MDQIPKNDDYNKLQALTYINKFESNVYILKKYPYFHEYFDCFACVQERSTSRTSKSSLKCSLVMRLTGDIAVSCQNLCSRSSELHKLKFW